MGVQFNAKYPWDRWFKRRRFTLRKGEDYTCSHSAMAQQIRNAAAKRGLLVSLVEGEGSFTVLIREGEHATTGGK